MPKFKIKVTMIEEYTKCYFVEADEFHTAVDILSETLDEQPIDQEKNTYNGCEYKYELIKAPANV